MEARPTGHLNSSQVACVTPALTRWGKGFDEVIATASVKRTAAPDEITSAAVYPASEYADSVHGTTLTVNGGRLAV